MRVIKNFADFKMYINDANHYERFTEKAYEVYYEYISEMLSYDHKAWDEDGNMLMEIYHATMYRYYKNPNPEMLEDALNAGCAIKVWGKAHLIRDY